MIYWIFGQPGSGKTELSKYFQAKHPDWAYLDGDQLRQIYSNSQYGIHGRLANHIKAIEICRYLQQSGKNIIVSMVTPYRLLRRMILEELKDVTFVLLNYNKGEIRGKEEFHLSDFESPAPSYADNEYLYINTSVLSLENCYQLLFCRIK